MEQRSNKAQNLIIVLCWAVYTFAYFGRYGYNSNITPIMADHGISKADAGLVSTCFFFAYGVGQVINGILSRRYNKKILFPTVLIASSILNILLLFLPFDSFKYVWLINGFLQSTLWSSIVCVLSTTLDAKHLNLAIVVLSTTSTAGTVLTYSASAFFVWLGNYRYVFIFGAVMMSAIALLWLIAFKNNSSTPQTAEKPKTEKRVFAFSTLIAVFICLAFFGVSDNLIKDGLNTWVPTILSEQYGMKNEVSILSTIVLPLLGMLGAVVAVRLNKIVTDFVSLIAIFFTASALFIAPIVLAEGISPFVMLICFGVVTLLMHAVNNVITAIAPLKLREKVDSGAIAGILNGFCYLGSTVSSYGLGAVADSKGWSAVFILIFAICIASVIIGFGYSVFSRARKEK